VKELQELVAAFHRQGIAVILDVVYNHFGPDDSILWQFDGSGPAWAGGIYFYGGRYPGDPRPQTPWGSRPDYGRPEVRQYLVDNAIAWLQDYRLDGLRLDATAFIRNVFGDSDPAWDIPEGWELLQQINGAVDGSQPWKIIIAEDMQDNDWITRPAQAQGAGFDAQWDPDFVQQVREVLEQARDQDRDIGVIQAMLEHSYAATAFARVVFTESHDADGNGRTRVPAEIDPAQPDSYWSKKRSTLGGALVLTAPGIPMLFQGQEFLEQRPFVQDPAELDWANATTTSSTCAATGSAPPAACRGRAATSSTSTPGPRSSRSTATTRAAPVTMSSSCSTSPAPATPPTRSACRERAPGGSASTATGTATTPGSATGPATTPPRPARRRTACRSAARWGWGRTRPSSCRKTRRLAHEDAR
jgi:1,4-alpha-glucan branching enzyme